MLRSGVSDVLDNTNAENPNVGNASSINQASRLKKILTCLLYTSDAADEP